MTKTLPCGHTGTAVIGQFFLCSVKDCDGKSKPNQVKQCPTCASADIYPFTSGAWNMFMPVQFTTACKACGKCWNDGVDYEDDDGA